MISNPAGWRLVFGAALLALVVPPARGQDGGPVVVTRREQLEWIQFEDIRLAFELFGRFRRDEVEAPDGSTVTDTEWLLREILEAETRGFIGHPNLIEFDLFGALQFEQQDLDLESGQVPSDSGENIDEYDVSALFLKEGPAPLTLYSQRVRTSVDQPFTPTIDSVITQTGARLRLLPNVLPTFLEYYQRKTDQSGGTLASDFKLDQKTFEWLTQARLTDTQTFKWDFRYDSIDERGAQRARRSINQYEAIGTHRFEFGPERRSYLRSNLQLFQRTGRTDLRRIRLDQRLRIRPSSRQETRITFQFEDQKQNLSRQRQYTGRAGYRYRYFDSLTTNYEVGASRFELPGDDFTSDEVFGAIELEYDKKVPYGMLNASTLFRLASLDESDRGVDIQVIDRLFIFPPSDFFVITQRNIVLSSIVITDATGLIVYTEGLDYTLRDFPDRVEVARIIGGAIAPGQAVLVDYRIGPEPASTTDTQAWNIAARYGIREGPLAGLGVFVRYNWVDQDRDGDAPDLAEGISLNELVYGADFEGEKLYLLVEARDRRSNFSPFESIKVEGRYTEPLGRGSGIQFSAYFEEIDRSDVDIRTTTTNLSVRWSQQINERLRTSLYVLYRMQDDDAGLDSEGFEQELDVTWNYRQTTIYGRLRNKYLDTSANDTSFQSVILGLRREF